MSLNPHRMAAVVVAAALAVERLTLKLPAQIEKLQREAVPIKAKELDGFIARIKEAIQRYGLTAADLGLTKSRTAKSGAASKTAAKRGPPRKARKSSGAVKFRGPEGQTWTGHGRAPNWYKEAIAGGATKESLLAT